jgi:hypothetical protein
MDLRLGLTEMYNVNYNTKNSLQYHCTTYVSCGLN